jgi:hypothetical protein
MTKKEKVRKKRKKKKKEVRNKKKVERKKKLMMKNISVFYVLNIKSTLGFHHASIKYVVQYVIPRWRKTNAQFVVQILRG